MGELKLPSKAPKGLQWNDLLSLDQLYHVAGALLLLALAGWYDGAVTLAHAGLVAALFLVREAEQEHADGGWRWRPWKWSWHRRMEWMIPSFAALAAAVLV